MATPSSSATSPSPPMAFLPHNPPQTLSTSTVVPDYNEREQRKKAVQRFLARAEISMVTRALRARLSYASYKATHNIHHVPLRDLEAQTQTQSQTASFSRTIAAKRKAAGSNNYYNNPATQSPHAPGAGPSSLRRGVSGAMPPPPVISSPRAHYPPVNNNAHATTSHNDLNPSSRGPNLGPSLYSSILAPPPAKQARTIHNAGDPPIPAPSRPIASPRARVSKPTARSIAEGTRAHAKGRPQDRTLSSPDKRKAKRASADKGKQKQTNVDMDVDVDGDIDMKAAATLTSLLLHHRPSLTGSSPRSSIDGSEAGSAYSYSHFAQSSARTTTADSPPAPVSIASTSTPTESSYRNHTPPPPNITTNATTPRPAPTDDEAADLMLFLATSPSPVRPPNRESRDLATYRALSGGPGALRDKGRVLFASSAGELASSEEPIRQALSRGGDSSFTSSISSIGTEMGLRPGNEIPAPRASSQHLLPPALPVSSPISGKLANRNLSPKPGFVQSAPEFNFSDFIHGSPSPSRGTVGQGHRGNLGLRADVGRKLFEEEQMRHAMSVPQNPGKRMEDRSLGAGIDLVQG